MLKSFYEKNQIQIYNCDNLELLRQLGDESVNLIYCDVLYNTGKNFDDYNDSLGTPLEAVEWYRPRFKEMKRVLTANGSIFIHCNWRLDSYLRILMDEIFGMNCFRNRIYRQHSTERGFCYNFDSQVDIILYYVKDPQNFVFNREKVNFPKVVSLYENGYIPSRSETRYLKDGTPINLKNRNKHWLVSAKQFQEMVDANEVALYDDNLPYRISYDKAVGNLWNEPEMLDNYSRTGIAEAYDTPKPESVLDRIIKTCSNEGDVVADFFMGGGTTAVVAKKLCRKGIFCDSSLKACKVTVSKLENS